MKVNVQIDVNSKVPVYKQIIQSIYNLINTNNLSEGEFLPSMNEMAEELEISKETVKKAYSILRKKGQIESAHGKGFYVARKEARKIRILLLFDKISTYKQVLYNSFMKEIGDNAEITIRVHGQDIELFEHFLNETLDTFDFYIVTPHFPLTTEIQKRAIKALKRIPNRKLILLDHNINELPGNYGSVYQDFENDVAEGLAQAAGGLKKYKKLNVVSMPGSLYAPFIEKGIDRFCTKHHIPYEIYKKNSPEIIRKNEAYLLLNSQLDEELIKLIKTAREKGCKIGDDIGIISYNESPINEIILNGLTVFSTDFEQMGKAAALMIIDKSFKKVKCNFGLVQRGTF